MPDTTVAMPERDHMAPHHLIAASYLLAYDNPDTRRGYGVDLRIFFDWCHRIGLDPMLAKRVHVQMFIRYLADERRYTPAGIGRTITPVKGFYDACVLDGHLPVSPAYKIRTPTVVHDPTSKPYLSRYELARLIDAAEERGPTTWALVVLMGMLALRVSTACRVAIEDLVTTQDGYRAVKIRTKGDKRSWKAIPIPAWRALDAAAGERTAGPLLLSRSGAALTRRVAGHLVDQTAKAASITKHVHPHMLRRTHATLAFQAGVSTDVIRNQLDHADERTTRLYIATDVTLAAQSSNTVSAMIAASR